MQSFDGIDSPVKLVRRFFIRRIRGGGYILEDYMQLLKSQLGAARLSETQVGGHGLGVRQLDFGEHLERPRPRLIGVDRTHVTSPVILSEYKTGESWGVVTRFSESCDIKVILLRAFSPENNPESVAMPGS